VDIEIGPPPRVREVADFGDGISIDSSPSGDARRAGTVADPAISQDNVVLRLARTGDEEKCNAKNEAGLDHPTCQAGFPIGSHRVRI
jgi:hypothetical protein